MSEPLVDYAAYRRYYTQERFGPLPGGRLGCALRFAAPMGSFKQALLTPAGRRVRELLLQFTGGRAPRHSGVARGRVYFKWAAPADRAPLLVAADAVRDLGYDVDVVEMVSDRGCQYVKVVVRW